MNVKIQELRNRKDRLYYVATVIKRLSGIYVALPLKDSPAYYEPYAENGIDVFYRADLHEDIKVVFDYLPTRDERGKILRAIREVHYTDAVYAEHVQGVNEK